MPEHAFRYEVGILKLRNRFQSSAARLLEDYLVDWFNDEDNYTRSSNKTSVI